MARKLASIVAISKVSPIEGADKLEVAEMVGKGWKVVTAKDEVHTGDLCVYFEIDSFLDSNDERYAFLKERCLRRFVSKSGNVLREGIKIKTIKLRGQISQGLLMPINKFPEITTRIKGLEIGLPEENGEPAVVIQPLLGADVTAFLHVEHYDEVKESLSPQMGNHICADALGKFPSDYVPKTDEERIQNLGDWFEKMKGRVWQVSCKNDGTSCTIAYSKMIDEENPEVVCSRNLRLKPEQADGKIPVYWQMAKQYDVLNKLKGLSESVGIEYAVQG